MRATTIRPALLPAAALAALLALPATADSRLTDEGWMRRATATHVEREIAAGANIDAYIDSGYSVLHMATGVGNLPAMRVLLRAGANPNLEALASSNRPGATPIHDARDGQAVALLFDHGARVEAAAAADGYTALHRAAQKNRVGAVRALLARGADPNARYGNGSTPLHIAAMDASPGLARMLLAAGADIDSRTSAGWTPLQLSAKYNDAAMVEALLDAGAAVEPPPGMSVEEALEALRRQPHLRGTNALRRLERIAAARMAVAGCDGWLVGTGDSRLGDVAEKALGDRSRWPEIARLNGISTDSPYRLGQCLKLP